MRVSLIVVPLRQRDQMKLLALMLTRRFQVQICEKISNETVFNVTHLLQLVSTAAAAAVLILIILSAV